MAAVFSSGRDPTKVVGRRVIAWLADSALDTVILLLALELLNVDIQRTGNTGTVYDFSRGDSAALTTIVLTTLCWAMFKVLTVAFFGWTPGKLMLGIRVVRWDGRPPGFLRAFGRGITVAVMGLFGCLYWIIGLASMGLTKEHRQPADWIAGTWVVDGIFLGRLILHGPTGALVGPPSVTRSEAAQIAAEQHLPDASFAALPSQKSTKPFYDKDRDTYVVWNEKRNAWLQFDKSTNEWGPLR